MLIKAVPTGRPFGSKIDGKISTVKVAGVVLTVREFDSWDGPVPEGDRRPQYWRMTTIDQPEVQFP